MRLKTLPAVSAAFVSVFLAQPALGATVRYESSLYPRVVYEAAVGESNDISVVGAAGGVFTITDLNAAITPETPECTSISPNAVRCEVGPDSGHYVRVLTKDGADSVDVTSVGEFHYSAFVDGGADSDTLSGTGGIVLFGEAGVDRLIGRSGGQELRGGTGADSLDGGPGRDELEGGAGTDVIVGGSGYDQVSYFDHTAPVRISLDGQANDGALGENDWIQADVESAEGSKGPTLFIGNAGPNEFYGGLSRAGDVVRMGAGDDFVDAGPGSDVLSGGAGDDFLDGEYGRDLLLGGPGDDGLDGFMGADVIRGGRGNDSLFGGWGADDLQGGSGNDYLRGQSHGDTLRGGPGYDRMFGNDGDDVLYARDRTRDRVDGDLDDDRAHVDTVDRLFQVEVLF
jgi:Ca2+-binding RTX toxin-like protein